MSSLLAQKLSKASMLLEKYLPFISQWDEEVIKGNALEHRWIQELMSWDKEKLSLFDAQREYTLLSDPEWIELIENINQLCSFYATETSNFSLTPLGNKKKQHELKQLYKLLENDHAKSITDFGGGVGNLAHFLHHHLNMNVTVLEKSPSLIEKGQKKLEKFTNEIKFIQAHIDHSPYPHFDTQMAIGLHTCGNFANNMLRACIENKTPSLVNFGCCYSKIENNDYNLSQLSNSHLELNSRALSCATLSFSKVPLERYFYRLKIMDYKYSFYHWLYKKQDIIQFCSMSNARRKLYEQSFEEFTIASLQKYFPQIQIPEKKELHSFYYSQENQSLLKYIQVYYAIARYLGKLAETYLLLDRAVFLEEQGYKVNIQEVFDPAISPRNKAIIAKR